MRRWDPSVSAALAPARFRKSVYALRYTAVYLLLCHGAGRVGCGAVLMGARSHRRDTWQSSQAPSAQDDGRTDGSTRSATTCHFKLRPRARASCGHHSTIFADKDTSSKACTRATGNPGALASVVQCCQRVNAGCSQLPVFCSYCLETYRFEYPDGD